MNAVELRNKVENDMRKSLQHFTYSFNKVKNISFDLEWDEETLETLESFASRFARLSDLFVSRYLRLRMLESDPGFRGTIIDVLNHSEKLSLIEDAQIWRRIRELRNVAAHDYASSDYRALYRELFDLSPHLLKISDVL